MAFDRRNLPDPTAFYEERGLKLTGRGKWRTTACSFHGGMPTRVSNASRGGQKSGAAAPGNPLVPHAQKKSPLANYSNASSAPSRCF